MIAYILKDFGGAENLTRAEIPVPAVQDNEVLVKVKAIAVNPVDVKTRQGRGQAGRLKDFDPVILGWDISGIVTETGKRVTTFKKGDEVFGLINFPGHGKAYAEFVAAPENQLALKPVNISHEEAAAASLAAMTAWQILHEKAWIRPGDKVLIHAAAGGVGHFAVQMAEYLGAWVVGTASRKNREFVLSLGASVHIDYETQRFEEVVNNLDFVLDTIGGDYTERSFKVLKPGAAIFCIPSLACENIAEKAKVKGLQGYTFHVRSNGENIKEISQLLQKGIVKPYISKRFSFDQIPAAHLQLESGKTKGKVVVTL